MLACIACTKEGGEDSARAAATPSTKDAVKSLTSQLKDMVLRFSGSYRQCKGGSSSSFRNKSFHHHPHHYRGGSYDAVSDGEGGGGYTYLQAASSSSTPAWDFTTTNSVRDDPRFKAKWIPGIGMQFPPEEEVVLEDDGEPKEWMAQVEPGVHITFVSLPAGAGNDLKRIRFSREMFDKWQAQRWWGENYDRIMELYNVQRFSRQALTTPPRSDDGERESFYSRVGSTRESPVTPPLGKERVSRNAYWPPSTVPGKGLYYTPSVPDPSDHIFPHHLNLNSSAPLNGAAGSSGVRGETSLMEASRATTSSRDEASISISNASDMEMTEWVEQDEPGVFITIRELPDGTRELRRVRFSRERFGEVHAKLWWEENRERIQAQYL
ncbi:protein Brevis radix-like 1 [Typha angustifolia]|uniref:protein Brevis radix-like 1 n=1 Tax=Typha angustifolia TaxID=59011 RepID=UPI003C2B8FCB